MSNTSSKPGKQTNKARTYITQASNAVKQPHEQADNTSKHTREQSKQVNQVKQASKQASMQANMRASMRASMQATLTSIHASKSNYMSIVRVRERTNYVSTNLQTAFCEQLLSTHTQSANNM